MPGDGDDGASVSFCRLQPLVEPADVRVAIGLEPHGAGSGFDEAPLWLQRAIRGLRLSHSSWKLDDSTKTNVFR